MNSKNFSLIGFLAVCDAIYQLCCPLQILYFASYQSGQKTGYSICLQCASRIPNISLAARTQEIDAAVAVYLKINQAGELQHDSSTSHNLPQDYKVRG